MTTETEKEDYLLFLARSNPEKGSELALKSPSEPVCV
jgi:hypothetical protein